MSLTVRFAPSPTGLLHVGNVRVALLNWLFAEKHGGTFLLRLDDTDADRSQACHAIAIERDLLWLGLSWGDFARQSDRLACYRDAFERLKAAGRVYACYETAEELEYKRRRQLARHKPPVYDRAGLRLSEDERQALEAEGRRPHWRFNLREGDIAWTDLIQGPKHFRAENLSDPVVLREDGTFLYMLPSAVDDLELGVSHVIRGEDHVANTPVQIQLIEALDGKPPAFGHLPLMTGLKGEGLSKREGALSVDDLRADGIEAMALNSLLAGLGRGDAIEPVLALDNLVAGFDLSAYGRASPKFDPGQLDALNARLLHLMPFEMVEKRLHRLGLDAAEARFWEAVRPNLGRLYEARDWYDVCFGDIVPRLEDADFTRAAAEALPDGPWDEATWKAWTGAVSKATGRKGRALFRPLRQALTGLGHGPEMAHLLPLIGRTRAWERLTGES